MSKAIIGASGFVGSSLRMQTTFEGHFRSTNITEIADQFFDIVVCAGAPAQKWIANRDPANDLQNIMNLIENVRSAKCKTFVLISTVDVFKNPIGVNEESAVDESGLHAYGLHRRLLETFVQKHFADYLIVRLPGLVGPRLRKNVIFDFLNENNLELVESRGVFQFYPMVNLLYDIEIALQAKIPLVHLTAEPVSVSDVASCGFGMQFNNALSGIPASYNMQTMYSKNFGGSGAYQYSARETFHAIRSYAQSEPRSLGLAKQGAK